MQAFTVPVAFLVEAESEEDAARVLSDILVSKRLTQDHRADDYLKGPMAIDEQTRREIMGPIESWWMPNTPETEYGGCGDIEQVLVFAPGTTYSPATNAMGTEAVLYWRKVIDAIGKDAIEYPVCGYEFMAGASCVLPPEHGGSHRSAE